MTEPASRAAALAALSGGDLDRLRALLDAEPALAAAQDDSGVPLPLVALYHRQPEAAALAAQVRRQHGPPLDLYEAAALGDEARIEALLADDPEAVGRPAPDGFTALHLAGFFGQAGAACLLVERGAPLEQPTANQMEIPPLGSAVAGCNRDVVRLLVDAGVDPEQPQRGGITPLMSAAAVGREDLVDLLVAAGADPAAVSDDGRTASRIAQERGHGALAERLAALAAR